MILYYYDLFTSLCIYLDFFNVPCPADISSTSQLPAKGAARTLQKIQMQNNNNNNNINTDELIKSDPISVEDIRVALSRTRPSSDGSMAVYEKWQKDFGSI